jgi:hypothetical protein
MRTLIIIFLASVQLGAAADWYVDNAAGAGSRNGTSWANAWTNLNSITGTAAGDTVYISGGTTSKTYRDPYWTPANGTAGNPITYQIGQEAGHSGRAIFDSQGVNNAWLYGSLKNITIDGMYSGEKRFVVTNAAGPSHWSIWCDGAADVTIRGVESWEAFRFNPGTNIHVSQCFVRPFPPTNGTPSYAILWTVRNKASEAMSYTNNSVKQCVLELPRATPHPSWGADGLTGGRCTDFQSNILYTVTGMEDLDWQHGDGWQVVANGAEGSWCRIANNSFTNFANYGLYWEMTGAVSNVHVFNNYVTHTTSATASSAAVGLVIACQGASGVTYSNLVVANNTVIDNYGRAGIAFADAAAANTYQNCVLANNLTYNSGVAGGEQAIRVGNSSGTNGLAIYGNKSISGVRGTNTIETAQLALAGGDNNLVLVSYSELSTSNNPRLQSTDTAAKDAGFDLSSYFTIDADGNARSGTWDLGAYEYLSSGIYQGFSFGPGVRTSGRVTFSQ